MTDIERFLLRLVEVLEQRDPTAIHRPISVADLRERVLPYRLHRDALRLTSSEDYELLVLRLVAEEGGMVRVLPAESVEDARAEVDSPNPDLDLVEALGETTLQIGAESLSRLMTARDRTAEVPSHPPVEAEAPPTPPTPPNPPVPAAPPVAPPASEPVSQAPEPAPAPSEWMPPSATVPPEEQFEPLADSVSIDTFAAPGFEANGGDDSQASSGACPSCSATLPPHRPVSFCPFCGHPIGATRCSRCAAEIEPGWKHCVACGHQVSPGSFA